MQRIWDQGLMGMRVGGKRKLQVPAHLGYGERSVGKIPPNSDLTFEIELLEVLTRDD
ncbi:FKBP-type peptidyl-prolyl cis-trans isomerase [Pseudomonas putida]|uniref:FKBP-type peptidyl-prolyl cis-trans isomerase n=1 Tax=Pseudomonas putida TaxID=303 RepID=UPI002FCD6F0E